MPSETFISFRDPAWGAGTSTVILSVSISTKGSSASKLSPIFLSHFETVASVIDSPSVLELLIQCSLIKCLITFTSIYSIGRLVFNFVEIPAQDLIILLIESSVAIFIIVSWLLKCLSKEPAAGDAAGLLPT